MRLTDECQIQAPVVEQVKARDQNAKRALCFGKEQTDQVYERRLKEEPNDGQQRGLLLISELRLVATEACFCPKTVRTQDSTRGAIG